MMTMMIMMIMMMFRFSVTGADISSGGTGGEMVSYNIQVREMDIKNS